MTIDFDADRAARRTDPQTSHDAAASMATAATRQTARVLIALRDIGAPAGAEQIAERCGMTQVQVCRRLPELHAAGLAEPTGNTRRRATGRNERLWSAT